MVARYLLLDPNGPSVTVGILSPLRSTNGAVGLVHSQLPILRGTTDLVTAVWTTTVVTTIWFAAVESGNYRALTRVETRTR